MADEGNKSEVQNASSDSGAHLSSMHISSYEEMKADNFIESEGRLSKASEGWLEAVAKDERAERARNRVQDSPRSQRSWQSRRASYRAYVDTQKTEQGWARKIRAIWEPPRPSEPYAKGLNSSFGRLWDKFWMAAWRVLGIQ